MASILSAGTTSATAMVHTADTSGELQLASNNGTVAVTVNTSQNVGIGTSSPSYRLDVQAATATMGLQSTTGTNSVYLAIANSAGNTYFGRDTSTGGVFGTAYATVLFSQGAYPMNFYTDSVERMRIDSSGRMIMASNANGLLGQIQAGITANSASTNSVITSTCNANGPYPFGARGETNTQGLFGFFDSSNSTIGSITKSGSSVAYNTSSDYRLKENIEPMTGALAKVAQLKPVTYTWKADGLDGEGFIAHELAEVKPHAVAGEKDAVEIYTDEEGNEQTRIKAQGIDTSFLVATLTAAIQELNAKVTSLEEQVLNLGVK
jgi:hypothetical protein